MLCDDKQRQKIKPLYNAKKYKIKTDSYQLVLFSLKIFYYYPWINC